MRSHSLTRFGALLCVAVVVLAACGGSKKAAPRAGAPSTTDPAAAVAPLTGLPDPGGAVSKRCAVTVKVDNTQAGHPKYGVDQADVVYEEVVEGGITRLAAIFDSHDPDRVGPVRSVRKTDQSLVRPIGGVFAYSGGAQYAIDSINTAPVKQLDENRAGALMFRDHSRDAPFNLYAHVNFMYAKCGTPVPPPPLFTYRAKGAPVGGLPTETVRVGFLAGFAVTWTWDGANGTWKRSIFGDPEDVASGTQLAPKNVVVMFVSYVGGDAQHSNIGAEAVLTGHGTAVVFTAGKEILGTWSRPDKNQPAQLLDAAGNVIALTPGQTWVELPETGYDLTKTP